jgi:membrane-associated HD superfamily phosphohydrolase
MNRQTALRILLAIVSISHLLLGLLAVVAPPETVARLVATFYGATLEVTPAVQHVLRILGAYMMAIGVMAAFAFFNPAKQKGILAGIILLLVLRVAQRLIFASEIQQNFGVSAGHLWTQSAFFLALATALFWARPTGNEDATK